MPFLFDGFTLVNCLHDLPSESWCVAFWTQFSIRKCFLLLRFCHFISRLHCELVLQIENRGGLCAFWQGYIIFFGGAFLSPIECLGILDSS